ncbi:MAG: 4Fe-4S binding protein [Proteobacteria bacterium]|nr:4Fe-4S binding protein [Pseudomonadota bacterium]
MRWLASLSGRQRLWLVLTAIVGLVIMAVGVVRQGATAEAEPAAVTVEMTLKQAAPQLGVTGKSLARELGLPLDTSKDEPLSTLGVTEEELEHVAHHLLGHRDSTLKYYAFVTLVLFGLVFLVRLGRPDGSPVADRRMWYPRWPYVAVLIVAVALCGFALGKSPNPMEGVVKVFKSFVGLYPSVAGKLVGFLFFAALAVVGNKLICGWACPFGALQELVYSLPILRNIKRRKIPVAVAETVRGTLFVVVLLVLFGVVGGQKGLVIYHFVNPFNLFNFDIETVSVGLAISMALLLSLGVYRPFCQLVCPFGLLSRFLERVSLFRVKIDRERCTECGACVRACPLEAAKGRLAGKLFPADCFSCARCLRACPEDALSYGLVGRRPRTDDNS